MYEICGALKAKCQRDHSAPNPRVLLAEAERGIVVVPVVVKHELICQSAYTKGILVWIRNFYFYF